MSRFSSAAPVLIAPQSNVYTVLAVIGFVVTLLGLLVLFLNAGSVFEGGLFG